MSLHLCLVEHRFLAYHLEATAQKAGAIEVRQRLFEIDVLTHTIALLIVGKDEHRLHLDRETLILNASACSIVIAHLVTVKRSGHDAVELANVAVALLASAFLIG